MTDSQYDGMDRMIQQEVSYNGGTTTTASWDYDDNGNLTEQIDGMGRTTEYAYDDQGNKSEEIDAYSTSLAMTTLSTYDGDMNLTTEVSEYSTTAGYVANTTTFEYDDNDLPTLSVSASGGTTTTAYNSDGQMASVIDADGRTQLFTYNAAGQELTDVCYPSSGSPYETISFGYDNDGNMTLAETIEGAVTSSYTMQYDPLGQITWVDEPTGVTLSMAYDGMGDRTMLEDSLGGTIESVYDPDQELLAEIYTQSTGSGPVGIQIQQQYDWEGRVTQVAEYDPSGTTLIDPSQYVYNARGEVAQLNKCAYPSMTASVVAYYTNTYEADQELTQQIDDEQGATTTTTDYGYDALGEVTTYGTPGTETTQTFNAAGNPNSSGDDTTAGNELTSYVDPATSASYAYAFDTAGNEIGMTEVSGDFNLYLVVQL